VSRFRFSALPRYNFSVRSAKSTVEQKVDEDEATRDRHRRDFLQGEKPEEDSGVV
jgi:hypothetical protein